LYIDPEDEIVNSKLDELIDDFSVTNFGGNIIKVFEYVSYNIEYAYEDNPAPVKKPSVVIQRERGDCVNQALLLQTMLEALYLRTYGSIPEDFSYFVGGIVDLWWTNSPLEEIIHGGHCWVVLNTKYIPHYILGECTESFQDTLVNVPVGDVQFFEDQETSLQFVTLELEKKKDNLPPLSIHFQGSVWMELEATWSRPFGEYIVSMYPSKYTIFMVNSKNIILKPSYAKLESWNFPNRIYLDSESEIKEIKCSNVKLGTPYEISGYIENRSEGFIWGDYDVKLYDKNYNLIDQTQLKARRIRDWFTLPWLYDGKFSLCGVASKSHKEVILTVEYEKCIVYEITLSLNIEEPIKHGALTTKSTNTTIPKMIVPMISID
jgi:transglutaminase-like putative cysteine protease